ncbi:MAG: IclR family transcriptional regulator [Fusicatenibacter sp.]|nr:IclR family transcriptional regulator [Fusicatenibacter sp.]
MIEDQKKHEEEKNPIQVADRLFQTMEVMAETGSVGLVELANQLDLHKSTVHRILNSLIYMGYAKQDPETGKYGLTFKLLELSNQLIAHVDVIEAVRPYLKRLMQQTGETVHFVQKDGNDAVYIDKVESHQNSVRMVSRVGSRIPLYCSGVGKTMAAEMTEEEVKKMWEGSDVRKMTPHTITDFDEFMQCLEEVRRKGYALDNEENELGVRCIAAGIPDYKGRPKYAFSISAPVNRMTDERIRELSSYVLEMKEEIRKEIF